MQPDCGLPRVLEDKTALQGWDSAQFYSSTEIPLVPGWPWSGGGKLSLPQVMCKHKPATPSTEQGLPAPRGVLTQHPPCVLGFREAGRMGDEKDSKVSSILETYLFDFF